MRTRTQLRRQRTCWFGVVALMCVALLSACAEDAAELQCPAGKTCGFTSIAAGYEHTCAIYSVVAGSAGDYGQVVCWGNNRDGRVGSATGFGELQAVAPVVVPDITDAKTVAPGGAQTCVLRHNGGILCWGSNEFGELGDGQDNGSFSAVTPRLPAIVRTPQQIAAGGSSAGGTTCLRDRDGAVFCWGRNHEFQVRAGTREPQSTAVKVQGLDAAADVVVGQDFACAIASGVVRCWGSSYGSAPSGLAAIPGALSLSAQGYRACALTTSEVACFTGFYGQPPMIALDAVRTPFAEALQVATGAEHTCVLRSDRQVACWGSPAGGRLGLGDLVDPNDLANTRRLTPAKLRDGSGDPLRIDQIASGARHTCAIDDKHDIYCWGDNTVGQLGEGTTISRSTPTLVTVR